jgi:septum formation inhibitor MinC
MLLSKALKMK